jgi:Lar family restriction alleviation protein
MRPNPRTAILDLIRPCPFCAGSDRLEVVHSRAEGLTLFAVACVQCGSRGPLQASPADAEEVWNARMGMMAEH